MKTVFRLYLNTSKGSDPFLYKELLSFNTRPKYDEHLHAFYFDAPLRTLLHLSFRSLLAENMWVQIGKPFPAVVESTFPQHLENVQFKNYLPLRRGLIENMTLNIITRETQYPLSDRVITSFLQNALQKEINKKEYHQGIIKLAGAPKEAQLPYQEIKEIVQRKWEQQDFIREQAILKQLTYQQQEQTKSLPLNSSKDLAQIRQKQIPQTLTPAIIQQEINKQLASELPYHPHLTLYVRKNQGRLLLKVNKQEMYKHGWKKQVGWAPIRETLVAATLAHTRILQSQGNIKLWDPFCGSSTIPIVAAAQYYSLRVRGDPQENFVWPHWNIFKSEYLQQYQKEEDAANMEKLGKLKLICSDISFQAANYSINNLKELDKSMPPQHANVQQNVKRLKPTDQIFQLRQGEWTVLCGDFEQVAKNVLVGQQKVNIVTNLPYTQSRSKDHIPLNQLNSIYRRFNKMIHSNKDKIANVFVIVNNAPSEIVSPHHFLSLSTQKWEQVASFESGGTPIGLYAWSENVIKSEFLDTEAVKHQLVQTKNQIESIDDQEKVRAELIKYRQKMRQIQKKNYFLPKHLLKFKKGRLRVIEKRRRRHLLRAYELFARRRDKLIAFTEYSKKKLEIAMLRRGFIWRKRNMRLLQGVNIEEFQSQLKKQFQGRVQQALARSQAQEKYQQQKRKQIQQVKQKEKEKKQDIKAQKYFARKGVQIDYKGTPPNKQIESKKKTSNKKR